MGCRWGGSGGGGHGQHTTWTSSAANMCLSVVIHGSLPVLLLTHPARPSFMRAVRRIGPQHRAQEVLLSCTWVYPRPQHRTSRCLQAADSCIGCGGGVSGGWWLVAASWNGCVLLVQFTHSSQYRDRAAAAAAGERVMSVCGASSIGLRQGVFIGSLGWVGWLVVVVRGLGCRGCNTLAQLCSVQQPSSLG